MPLLYMKTIKIDINKIKSKDFELIVDYLRRGKVIAYPTDTIYGLGSRADNEKAINKIYKIKKRSKKMPLLCLISSISMAKKYIHKSAFKALDDVLNDETDAILSCMETEDWQEGIDAFIEKRKPSYRGK